MAFHDLILGTAGHIDHGKTSLIRALTGVDTDRLPEEQKRGITIELGFAHLDVSPYRFGIVDVPGHERFVRNMLAGATGMDSVLLVVAADDSIKPQTREHLDILRLLQLPAGVIAITKCDLVEKDWLDLVEDEVRELVQGTCLEHAPVVRTSAANGLGLDQLKASLKSAAEFALAARSASLAAPFRMAIDRTFTVAGHGTVVTGSVVSGATAIGEELEIAPGGVKVRVRGLQNHDRPAEEVHRGQRAAINLVGVHHNETARGQELIAPKSLQESRRLTVRLHHVGAISRPLKNRARIRLHLGTSEQLATVRILNCEFLKSSSSCLAQLQLCEPVVAGWRQPFVVRTESPVATIGGGIVLDPDAQAIKATDESLIQFIEELEHDDSRKRVGAAIYLRHLLPWSASDLFHLAGVSDAETIVQELIDDGTLVAIELSPQRTLRIHRQVVEELGQQIAGVLEKLHDRAPLKLVFPFDEVASRFDYLPHRKLFGHVVNRLKQQHLLRSTQQGIGLSSRGPKLSQNEVKLFDQLVRDIKRGGMTPPTPKQLEEAAVKNKDSVRQLLQLGVGQGDLIEISKDLYFHQEVFEAMWQKIQGGFLEQGGLTVSAIKDLLGFSRKYAVPFCEYLDAAGLTRRDGDLRYPAHEISTGSRS